MPQHNELNRAEPIRLSAGLDFSSAKVSAESGSLSDCYNHEHTDREGYRRVDGFERFDGRYPPSFAQDGTAVYMIRSGEFDPPIVRGDVILLDGVMFGKVLASTYNLTDNRTTVAFIRFSNAEVESDVFEIERTTENFTGDVQQGPPPFPVFSNTPVRADDNVRESNLTYDTIQTTITKFSNGRRAHGLHWFKDRLYAVVDNLYIPFTSGSEEIFANDVIEWDTADYTALVNDVILTSGTWVGGDAAGYIVAAAVIEGGTEIGVDAEYIDGWLSQNINILRDTPVANAATVATFISNPTTAPVTTASLWRCDNELLIDLDKQEPDNTNLGWNPVDMGYEIGFEDGEYFFSVFNTLNRTNLDDVDSFSGQVVALDASGTGGGPQLGEDVPLNGPTGVPWRGTDGQVIAFNNPVPTVVTNLGTPADYQSDDGDGLIIVATPITIQPGSTRRFTDAFAFSNFIDYNTIPAGSSITGFEVRVKAFQTIGGTDTLPDQTPTAMLARIRRVDSNGQTASESRILELNRTGTDDATAFEHIFGGPNDTFGIDDDLVIEDITPTNFFIDFLFFTLSQSEGLIIDRSITIDYIKVIPYYTAPNSKVYFWDGVDDVSANIVAQWVKEGSLLIGDGTGRLQLYNVEGEAGAVRDYIKVTDEIRTAPNGAGNQLGTVTEFFRASSLPSLSEILEAQSRYQFITANFYARDEWDAFYGVSGAARGFVWDGFFFRNVFTGLPDDLDAPRHVAYHHGHLVLGYSAGVVEVSAAGSPEDYYTPGAFTEIGFGDRITGLLPMNGTTLGVFCEKSIWGMVGTNVDDLNTQVLSPDEGAIEYTVCDVGKPIWCSYNGISNYDQTAAYGDFQGARLSSIVHPWLLGRLSKDTGLYGLRGASSVVCALPINAKNQYRVFFEDGYVLTMTLFGAEQRPVFTIQQNYVDEEPDLSIPGATNPLSLPVLVPIAHSAQVDSFGRNRVHVSHYSRYYPNTNTNETLKYVFELDKGWSFDGTPIAATFTTNWMFLGDPFETKRIAKVRLYGQSLGYAQLKVDIGRDFMQPDGEYVNTSLPLNANIVLYPNDADEELKYDFIPYSSIAEVAKRGINICIRYTSSALDNADEDLHVQPPYVCQALLVQTKDGQ